MAASFACKLISDGSTDKFSMHFAGDLLRFLEEFGRDLHFEYNNLLTLSEARVHGNAGKITRTSCLRGSLSKRRLLINLAI